MVESGLLAAKGGIVLDVGLEPFKHVSDRASVLVAEPAGDVDASFAPKPRENPCLPAAVCLPRRQRLRGGFAPPAVVCARRPRHLLKTGLLFDQSPHALHQCVASEQQPGAQVCPRTLDAAPERVVDESLVFTVPGLAAAPKETQPVKAKPSRRREQPQVKAVAAPAVLAQSVAALLPHGGALVSRADRIQVNVAKQFHRVGVRLHQMRLEAALEEMPAAPMPPVEARKGSVLPFDTKGVVTRKGSVLPFDMGCRIFFLALRTQGRVSGGA